MLSALSGWRRWPQHPLWSFYVMSIGQAIVIRFLGPVLPLYVRDFDVSYWVVGLVLTASSIGTMLGDIPAGMLQSRWRGQTGMLAGSLVYGGALSALFWAPSIPVVIVCQLVLGMGLSLFKISQHAYITSAADVAGRGRVLAGLGGVFRIGGMAGPAAGGALAEVLGLRAPFLVASLVCLGIALLVLRLPPEDRSASQALKPPSIQRLWDTFRARRGVLGAAGTGMIFVMIARAGRVAIVPLYGADVVGLSLAQIGLIVSLSWAVDLSLFGVAGTLMDRWGRKYAIVPSFVIQAVGLAVLPLTGDFAGFLLVNLFIGGGNGIAAGTMLTLGSDLAPDDARGDFLGLWHLVGDVGYGVGPLTVGAIGDLLALGPASLALAGASLTASLIFAFWVPETLPGRRPPERAFRSAGG